MNIFKTILCACLIVSISAFGAANAFADSGSARLRDVKDAVPDSASVRTLRFYMPTEWRNTYNDSYDGASLSSCTAGIYWWSGSCTPKEFYGGKKGDWPGFSVHETEPSDPNIFVAKIPSDVSNVIFNNTVEVVNRDDNDKLLAAFQTVNINTDSYFPDEDEHGFYPQGKKDCDGMIFVCSPPDNTLSEYSGNPPRGGEWFYYYGNGKYGWFETIKEAQNHNAVFSGGEWPVKSDVQEEPSTPKAPKPKTVKKPNPIKAAVKTVKIKAKSLKKKSQRLKPITVKKAQGKLSFKLLKKGSTAKLYKRSKISSKGVITIKKCALKKKTYKLKAQITASGNANYKSKTITKTIKIKVR